LGSRVGVTVRGRGAEMGEQEGASGAEMGGAAAGG